jgi:hypothetical protein
MGRETPMVAVTIRARADALVFPTRNERKEFTVTYVAPSERLAVEAFRDYYAAAGALILGTSVAKVDAVIEVRRG